MQTIIEAGFDDLARAVAEAFDGATVSVAANDGLFELQLHQKRHAAARCGPPNYPTAHCDSCCGVPLC